ncbi:MAG TPA: HAMP domain-containing sensor histidine kinase [Ktedonobacteraceae bacterium]|nr:HAMP domain-containing sensor histidine kinase [Ktedonobacteraceae bacterium]
MAIKDTTARTRWRHSIRWRLALGSILVSLLATALLALSVILAIVYYYNVDESDRINSFAASTAQRVGVGFAQGYNLNKATAAIFPNYLEQNYQGEQYLFVILNRRGQVAYPRVGSATTQSTFTAFAIALADPGLRSSTLAGLRSAVASGERGVVSRGELGGSSPVSLQRPYVVYPIFFNAQSSSPVVGVLVLTPLSAAENSVPPFISAVGITVLVAAIIVATISALAAILFSRTITRPLANLTKAARVLGSGNYAVQVNSTTHDELGELSHTFNEMAAKLANDVQELQRQEQWRRELIMNITHDLATPLTAIAGLGDSLVDGVNKSYEDYEATGRVIVRETLRLRRLVKDLHMMAKVEARAIQPQRKPVRLAALVDEELAVLATEFERVDVEPRNAIPFNLPAVFVDPDMLTRVFSNLCDNALRHTPPGGNVSIEAIQHGDRVLVAVTDSGEGIPTGALPLVFERFFRADSARQTTTGGSGLGLAIVQAIIEAHNGTIWAENVPNGGARFIFSLPIAPVESGPIWNVPTLPMPRQ